MERVTASWPAGGASASPRRIVSFFMDSDTVLLSEPDLELLEAEVAARPVDVKGMCTSGIGDPRLLLAGSLPGFAEWTMT